MFDFKPVQDLLKQAAQEKWSYPKTFDALKAAGVTHYDVICAQHAITYFAHSDSWKTPVPSDFQTLPVAQTLDKVAFGTALKRAQTGQINYSTFLKEIAAAGCSHYHVDMSARHVTYMGDDGAQVVEPVPPSK